MSDIMIFFIVGGSILLVALALNVFLIVQGFRISVKRGVATLAAAAALCTGLSIVAYASHRMAIEIEGADEVNKKGQAEVDKKIEELNNVNPADMQLDL